MGEKKTLVAMVAVCLLLVLQQGEMVMAQAQTTAMTLYFTGGVPLCSQCGAVGQYACSKDQSGQPEGHVRLLSFHLSWFFFFFNYQIFSLNFN